MTEATTPIEKLLLYTGLTYEGWKTPVHAYVHVTPEDIENAVIPEDAKRSYFDKPLYPGRPGNVIVTFWRDEDRVMAQGKHLYEKQWDRNQAAAMTIASEAIDARVKMDKRGKVNPALEFLKPLREQYNRLPWTEQPYFLMTVIRYITQTKSGRLAP